MFFALFLIIDFTPDAVSDQRVLLLLASLYVVFMATFLALMLFFWLELFGDLAAGNMQVIFVFPHNSFHDLTKKSCCAGLLLLKTCSGYGTIPILGWFL